MALAATSVPTAEQIERAEVFARERFVHAGEVATDVLAAGSARRRALDAALRELRGTPVVVNLWASWCGPCRFELPFLQRQYLQHGTRVAFLGVNTDDAAAGARRMLRDLPAPYPSVVDARSSVAGRLHTRGLPVTAYYDRQGKLNYVHQGAYPSEAQLAADIKRYAGA